MAAGLYSINADPIPAAAVFCSGFLIDGDHLLDLWLYQKHRLPGEGIMDVFDNHTWVKSIIPFHAIEWLFLVFCLVFINGFSWLWCGVFLGFGVHLIMDQVGNKTYPLSYSLIYRWSKNFNAPDIWTDCKGERLACAPVVSKVKSH